MGSKQAFFKKDVLKQLYFNKSLSIADLSTNLNKSVPIIIKSVSELINEGKVIEMGLAPSTGGRRAAMYALKPDINYIVAVAMDQFITRIALVDMANHLASPVKRVDIRLAGNKSALDQLISGINEFLKDVKVDRDTIIGIGIGMPGFIDAKKGLNHSFLEGKPINDLVCEATGLATFIDNDSSLIALAELKFGAARNKKNAMVINIGWGVGLGMVLNGNLYRGENGFAGEFSHISLFSNNKLCSCGKMGCLETETSLLVIIEKARQGLASGRNSILKDQLSDVTIETAFELIANAAQKGDQFAIEIISKAAYEIGRGVSILIHLLNPSIIILSGRGALAGKAWRAPIQQAVNEYSIPSLAAHTEIEISTVAYNAELIGAAALVMENFERHTSKLPLPHAASQ